MPNNKIPTVPPIEIGYIAKIKEFATNPQTVKYMGRTFVVISIAFAAYFVYKNRSKIYCTCHKTIESVRNKFKRDSGTKVYHSPSVLNIYVQNPGVVSIHHVKEESEEGKEARRRASNPSILPSSTNL